MNVNPGLIREITLKKAGLIAQRSNLSQIACGRGNPSLNTGGGDGEQNIHFSLITLLKNPTTKTLREIKPKLLPHHGSQRVPNWEEETN